MLCLVGGSEDNRSIAYHSGSSVDRTNLTPLKRAPLLSAGTAARSPRSRFHLYCGVVMSDIRS
jgi:hypothetical protein